jgi:hypothetical protein
VSPSLRAQSVLGGNFRVLHLAAERLGGRVYEGEGPKAWRVWIAVSGATHERAIAKFRAAAIRASAVDIGTTPNGFAYAVVTERTQAVALVDAGLATAWRKIAVRPRPTEPSIELPSDVLEEVVDDEIEIEIEIDVDVDVDVVVDDEPETVPSFKAALVAPIEKPRRRWAIVLAVLTLATTSFAVSTYRPKMAATDSEPVPFTLDPAISPVVIESSKAPRSTEDPSEPLSPRPRRAKAERPDDPMTL